MSEKESALDRLDKIFVSLNNETESCTKMLDKFDIPKTTKLNGVEIVFTLSERVEFLCQLYADLAYDYIKLAKENGQE